MSQSKSKGKRAPIRNKRSPWPIVMLLGGLALVAAVIIGNLVYQPGQQTETLDLEHPAWQSQKSNSSPEAQIDGLKVDFGDMKLGLSWLP